MYEKLNTDIKFKLGPIDVPALEQQYSTFSKGNASQQAKDKAAQYFQEAFYSGKGKDDQLRAQHVLKEFLDKQRWKIRVNLSMSMFFEDFQE